MKIIFITSGPDFTKLQNPINRLFNDKAENLSLILRTDKMFHY